MANFGPIIVSGNIANTTNPADIARFVSAFTDQVAQQFNSLLSVKSAWGAIGLSGNVVAGSSNFTCSLISLGTYLFMFRQPRLARPSLVLGGETFASWYGVSISAAGFYVIARTTAGALVNLPFSFNATGSK